MVVRLVSGEETLSLSRKSPRERTLSLSLSLSLELERTYARVSQRCRSQHRIYRDSKTRVLRKPVANIRDGPPFAACSNALWSKRSVSRVAGRGPRVIIARPRPSTRGARRSPLVLKEKPRRSCSSPREKNVVCAFERKETRLCHSKRKERCECETCRRR